MEKCYIGGISIHRGGSMKLTSIIVYTNQLFEMHAFYEALGLRFIEQKIGSKPEYFTCNIADDIELQLHQSRVNSFRLGFKSANISDKINHLQQNGWSKHMTVQSVLTGLYLIDPAGNEVIVNSPKSSVKFLGID